MPRHWSEYSKRELPWLLNAAKASETTKFESFKRATVGGPSTQLGCRT